MPPMKEASPDVEEDEEAIGTAVPEPSFGWLPDPAAQIRSSVSGAAAPVSTAPPAPRIESDGAAKHESRAAAADGRLVTHTASPMQPPAKQLRRGFLNRPHKHIAPARLDMGRKSGTANSPAMAAASAEEVQLAVNDGVSAMRLDPVGNGSAGDPPPPSHTASMPASGPERARRDVFRQLQPLCSALLPLRADAGRLAPALRALEAALRTADPLGLQAWLSVRSSTSKTVSALLTRITSDATHVVSGRK